MRLLRWGWVRVSGPSMVPTLRHGDLVLVRWGAPVRSGDVVLARFRSLPERLVIKRADRPEAGAWQLRSDNDFVGGDSASHGLADVLARAVLVWPGSSPALGRLRPRRLP